MVARRSDFGLTRIFSGRGSLRRCAIASKWNVEGGLYCMISDGFLSISPSLLWPLFPLGFDADGWVDGFGHCPEATVGMRVSCVS